jgi:hypothetical protein
VYSRDHTTGVGARTAAASGAEMAEENTNNKKDNDDESSNQTIKDHKKQRYRSDDSVACMLGEKLNNFTVAIRADVSNHRLPKKYGLFLVKYQIWKTTTS